MESGVCCEPHMCTVTVDAFSMARQDPDRNKQLYIPEPNGKGFLPLHRDNPPGDRPPTPTLCLADTRDPLGITLWGVPFTTGKKVIAIP